MFEKKYIFGGKILFIIGSSLWRVTFVKYFKDLNYYEWYSKKQVLEKVCYM